jgi:hypothetical protein
MKTSELIGPALDWAVSAAEMDTEDGNPAAHYSTDWAQGGPIIEREKMGTIWIGGEWQAQSFLYEGTGCGPTPLISAMRCFVASKLGDEIDIPEELK